MNSLATAPARPEAPWWFRLGKALDRRGIRGGWRLVEMARAMGLLQHVVRYDVGEGLAVDVPLFRRENCWDRADVAAYERDFVRLLAELAADLPRPVTLLDCGADIGLVSMRLLAERPTIDRVVAFEPDPLAFTFLARNLSRLGRRAEARHAAVGDFAGRGELQSPDYDRASAFARFVVASSTGAAVVERVDDVVGAVAASVVMKVDVEGTELGVVRGAVGTLRRAPAFVVGFEANRDVVARTCTDPTQIVRALQALRPCEVRVSEAPGHAVDLARPFFDQLPGRRVYNLVCASR